MALAAATVTLHCLQLGELPPLSFPLTGTIAVPEFRGWVRMRNAGPNVCWFAFGAVPPDASYGDGRYGLLPFEAVELNNVQVDALSFAVAEDTGAVVEVALKMHRS
jgi:hypothetical protein